MHGVIEYRPSSVIIDATLCARVPLVIRTSGIGLDPQRGWLSGHTCRSGALAAQTRHSGASLTGTEHELQLRLTHQWLADGITLGCEVLRLVAWEVMVPSWSINDARRGFGQPAIDFLAIDADDGPVAIELKLRATSPTSTWWAACQLTHMTLALGRTMPVGGFVAVSDLCRSGRHGRLPDSPLPPLALDLQPERGWRRILAAPEIDTDLVARASDRLGLDDPPGSARTWLATQPDFAANRVVSRLATEPTPPSGRLLGPILALSVPYERADVP